MAEEQLSAIISVKVTPETKRAWLAIRPNPSQFLRNLLNRALGLTGEAAMEPAARQFIEQHGFDAYEKLKNSFFNK